MSRAAIERAANQIALQSGLMLAPMNFDTTEREDAPVIYAASAGTPQDIQGAAQRAWQGLEALVPPRGRKAYGYWNPEALEYRACYSLEEDDHPEALGLQQTVLPGGRYRRARLQGDDVYGKIGQTFDALAEGADVDDRRPWIEFYRRQDEVDVLLPIRD
jgi:DNA gyrase inhibitor GyrI